MEKDLIKKILRQTNVFIQERNHFIAYTVERVLLKFPNSPMHYLYISVPNVGEVLLNSVLSYSRSAFIQERICITTQCEKNFTHQSSLQQHCNIYTGEKPYLCSQCGKSFKLQHNLKLHWSIQKGEKPNHCSVCGKNFTYQCNLQIHLLCGMKMFTLTFLSIARAWGRDAHTKCSSSFFGIE